MADAASVGRTGYAYAHAMMVAGVILVAVAIHLTIDNPDQSASAASALTMLGGPALFFAGLALFKRVVSRGRVGPVLAAIGGLAVLSVLALFANRLIVMCAAALLLMALAVAAGRSAAEPAGETLLPSS